MYAPYEGRYFHDLVTETFSRAGILPNYAHHVAQIHSILALVHAGVGVSLVPTAAAYLQFRNVVLRPIHPLPPRPAELFMVWRTDNRNALVPIIVDLSRKLVEMKLPRPIHVQQRRGIVETAVASPS
jgi:DNA-binding transcriptional LysR family regulator